MVKDIKRGAESSFPAGLASFGDLMLFAADDGTTSGQELWRSDGTRAGTQLVKDITPGGHRRSRPGAITKLGSFALFRAFYGGEALYRTDGTRVGTHVVRKPRDGGPTAIGPELVRVSGLGVLFEAAVSALWKSNGWRDGTVEVADLNPMEITALAPSLAVFAGDDGVHGQELWATDGTQAGTHMVADINHGG
jgi:ELWxxDGT repeat protein